MGVRLPAKSWLGSTWLSQCTMMALSKQANPANLHGVDETCGSTQPVI